MRFAVDSWESLDKVNLVNKVNVAGVYSTSPLTVFLAALQKITSWERLFRAERRVGQNGEVFGLYTFRLSHCYGKNECGAGHTSWVGRLVRALHLEGLPQLVNVLRGDMGLFGPRAHEVEFVARARQAIPFYHLRHYIRPGLTGWAQVHVPPPSSIEEARRELEYDLYYIAKNSLLLDLRILWRWLRGAPGR